MKKPKLRAWHDLPLVLAFWSVLLLAGFAAEPAPEAKLPQRVIYFGYLQTERAKDFVGFLERYFNTVRQAELATFREKDAETNDVVILDYGELKISNNSIQIPPITVSRGFRRPTITIGAAGALVSERLGLKTGYL